MSAITASDVKALRDRTGAGDDGLQERAGRGRRRLREGRRAAARPRRGSGRQARRQRGHRGHDPDLRAHAGAGSACWSRSTARPTSSPATTTSSRSPRTWRCTSPAAGAARRDRGRGAGRGPRDARCAIATEQAADRPENVREKIVEGTRRQVARRRRAAAPEARQRGQVRAARRSRRSARKLASDMGENVVIRRFARFAVGE